MTQSQAEKKLRAAGFSLVKRCRHGLLYSKGPVSVMVPSRSTTNARAENNIRRALGQAARAEGVRP